MPCPRPFGAAEIQKRGTCKAGASFLERLMGVEPTYAAWEAAVLPMNYSRSWKSKYIITDLILFCNPKMFPGMIPRPGT